MKIKKIFPLYVAFVILIANLSLGTTQPTQQDFCNNREIESVQLPYFYEDPNTPSFTYKYRYKKSADPKAPLVIALPGGMNPSIELSYTQDSFPTTVYGGIPNNYNIIYTDPRGTGCNTLPNGQFFPDDFYDTRLVAQDIIQLVKTLETRQDSPLQYYLWGVSYGTVQATMFTSLAEQQDITLPQAVVLEGIAGRHFTDFNDFFSAYQQLWLETKSQLSQKWIVFFDTNAFDTSDPAFSSRVWGKYVYDFLKQTAYLIPYQLSEEGQESLTETLTMINESGRADNVEPSNRLFTMIACRELTGDFYIGRDMINGQLTVSGPDICQGLSKLDHAYDPAQWPITKTMIIYVQGTADPSTPYSMARYHHDTHPDTKRLFVTIENVGHGPLSVDLRENNCVLSIWNAITNQDRNTLIPFVLGICEATTQLKTEFKTAAARLNNDEPTCQENWQCADWGACTYNLQIRTCVDLNNCDTELNKPSTLQECASPQPPNPPIQPPEQPEQPDNNKLLRIIIIGGGGVAIYYFLRERKRKNA